MSESIKLTLENREVIGKKVKLLRKAGITPATVYGKGVGPFSVQLPSRGFLEAYRKAGRTKLIELTLPGQPILSAFIHALQRHPVSREIIHVDFRAVDLKQNVVVAVPLHTTGTSPLVGRGDAVLNQSITTIEVSALPAHLPSHIDVDVSGLDSFDKSIHISDLVAPEGTTFVAEGSTLVVSLTPIRASAEDQETVAPAEPELIREKREEE